MTNEKVENLNGDVPSAGSLQRLLLFRLLMAVFFLLLTLWVQTRREQSLLSDHLQPLYFFACIILGFTIVAGLSLRHVRNLRRFAYIQLLFDVEAVTFLIYLSGGIESLFSFLYMPVIISSALLLYLRGSLLIASACALSYGLLVDMQYFKWISPIQIVSETTYLKDSAVYLHSLLMNTAAFYVVAYLSGYLATGLQSSRRQLREQRKDLHQLEKLHQNIVQSISSGLISIDTSGHVLFFNRAVLDILGVEEQQMQGHTLCEIIPGVDPASWSQREAHLLSRMEVSYQHPSGEELCLGYSVSELEREDGTHGGWIIIFQDLTELKTLETHMRRMERLAYAGRVASEIAHEIKNPLAAMSGAIQLLQSESSENELHARLMDIVGREIHRINELVTSFLWLSKGVQKPEKKEPVPVCGIIQEILALLTAHGKITPAHEVSTCFELDPALMMDCHHFRQIMWNLLENALEAMPDGGGLAIRVGLCDAHNGEAREVRIAVQDTGPGLADEIKDNIFEPFLSTKEQGFGLGLSIVYRLVKDAGGHIAFSEPPQGGSLFSIFFPLPATAAIANEPHTDYK